MEDLKDLKIENVFALLAYIYTYAPDIYVRYYNKINGKWETKNLFEIARIDQNDCTDIIISFIKRFQTQNFVPHRIISQTTQTNETENGNANSQP